MSSDAKYYGASTTGAALGLALGLLVAYLVWPQGWRVDDVAGQLMGCVVTVGGTILGFIAGAEFGMRWENRR